MAEQPGDEEQVIKRYYMPPPRMLAWRVPSHNLDISYVQNYDRGLPHTFMAHHTDTSKHVGIMYMDHEGKVTGVETHPEHRHQGVASVMWNIASQASQEHDDIPSPKHSAMRTPSGDKWAKAMGGELPKRSVVSAAQFKSHRWK